MHRAVAAAALALVGPTALAGTPCDEQVASPELLVRSMQMADLTRTALEGTGDDVVLIARVGQDLSAYRLTYSHAAFAMRAHPAGAWSVVHKLNACGTATSALYDEGLINFFSDAPVRYQAGIWRLAPAVQARLKNALLGDIARDFHEPQYSLAAYPFSTRYQNSNGWVLEMLAYAIAPKEAATNRATAQAWLASSGYQPTELALGTMTRFGARVSKANIAFDDHPSSLRWKGRIQTVSVESIVTWLRTFPNVCQAVGCPELPVVLPSAGP